MRCTLLVVFFCVVGAWGFTIEDRDVSVVLASRPREVSVTLEDVVPKRDEEDTDDDLREIFNESMRDDGDELSTLAKDKTPDQFLESALLSEELEAERRDLEMLMGSDPELLALYKEEFHEVESRVGEGLEADTREGEGLETDTRKISAGQAVAGGLAVGAAGTLLGQFVKNKYQQQQQLQQSQYGHSPYQPYGHHYVHPSAYGPSRPVYGGYVQPATHHYVQPAVHHYIQPSYQSHSYSHSPYNYGRLITPQAESVGARQAGDDDDEEEEGLLDNLATLANPIFHANNLVNHANNLANHAIVHANHLVNHANDLANYANHDDIHANNLSHLENHANDHADHHANLHANLANFAIGKQLPADVPAVGGLYQQLHPAGFNIPYGYPYASPYQYTSYAQPTW